MIPVELTDLLTEEQALKVRRAVYAYGGIAVALLLVVGAVGGYATYRGHAAPGTHVEQHTETVMKSTGSFSHGVTVTRENEVFERGTHLTNRSVYFLSVSPVLDGEFTYRYQAASGSTDATVRLQLVFRSVDEESGDVYWKRSRTVSEQSFESVEPGEQLRVPYSVNVSAAQERLRAIEESLGGSPRTTQLRLVAVVDLNGSVVDTSVARAQRYRFAIEPSDGIFRVSSAGPTSDQIERTVARRVANETGLPYTAGGPGLLAIALAGAGLLVAIRRHGPLTETERARLAYLEDRERFDDWIARMSLPEEALERPRAEAESLADLVDFAIDTDNGVVEQSDEVFVFVHDGYCYTYEAPKLDDDEYDVHFEDWEHPVDPRPADLQEQNGTNEGSGLASTIPNRDGGDDEIGSESGEVAGDSETPTDRQATTGGDDDSAKDIATVEDESVDQSGGKK